jgi:glycosyltransferase involved in cell wall biosynthesis
MVKSTIFECEMKDKKKILFIHTTWSTFVKTDFEILSGQFEVIRYQFRPVKGLPKTALQFGKQFFYLLFQIWKYDAVFIWFADYHSFLPVLFAKLTGKKSFLVIGGYDVVKMPELNYGVFTSKIRGFCAQFSMKQSSMNLAVSKNVERKVRWIAPKANTRMLYNCVNISANREIQIEKENLVITVGLIDSERTFFLKGMDTFIKVAETLPEVKFMAIGISKNLPSHLLKPHPINLEWIERVKHEELEGYYKKAKIYCQFSRSESFGVSIVEAMSFGCIPVVTNVGGMPELVRDFGIVAKRDASEISDSIKKAIKNEFQPELDSNVKSALKPFLFKEREKSLLNIMNQLL